MLRRHRIGLLVLALAITGCGIAAPFEEIGDDLARTIGPSTVDSALLLALPDVRDTFRAVYALPDALDGVGDTEGLGYEMGAPDGEGRRAWRSTYHRFSSDPDPIVVEGTALPLEPDAWTIELRRIDEPMQGGFVLRRQGSDRATWTGGGTYDGPWSARTRFESGPSDPFGLLTPPVSPGLIDPYEFTGCLTLEVEYLGDLLEARRCHDGESGFTDVVRNGFPDPGGVQGAD